MSHSYQDFISITFLPESEWNARGAQNGRQWARSSKYYTFISCNVQKRYPSYDGIKVGWSRCNIKALMNLAYNVGKFDLWILFWLKFLSENNCWSYTHTYKTIRLSINGYINNLKRKRVVITELSNRWIIKLYYS